MLDRSKKLGSVALEFLLLFPLVVSLIYAAGVYGVLFSWQVRMQVAVDRATAAVMQLDRSQGSPTDQARTLANTALSNMNLPFMAVPEEGCKGNGNLITCELAVSLAGEDSSGPRKLGFFGGFPPMPDQLTATASVAY